MPSRPSRVATRTRSHPTNPDRRVQEVREYTSVTPALADWLRVELVAMEATSAYWKPVFYLLETRYLPRGLSHDHDLLSKRLTIVSRYRADVRRLLPMGRNLAQDENKPDARSSIRMRYAVGALLLVAVPFALLLALVQVRWAPLRNADLETVSDLHGYAVTHSAFVTAMRTLSIIGSYRIWVPVLSAVAAWLFWRRQPRRALFVAVTAIGSSLINNLVKSMVDRARPILRQPVSVAHGFSFPSGHAQAAVVGYGILLVIFLPMLHRAVRILVVCVAVLMIAAIGFARIALGVHYLSDVLAGYLLGAAWLAAMVAAFGVGRLKP